MPDKKRRVVVTGIGPLTPIGFGKDSLWDSILKGKSNIKLEKCFIGGELWDSFYIHKVENFDILKFNIGKDKLEYIKELTKEEAIDLFYLIASVKLALDDSNLRIESKDKVSLILTHENPGMGQFFERLLNKFTEILKGQRNTQYIKNIKQIMGELYNFGAKSAYNLQTFMILFQVARIFDIHYYSLFINNACSSGLYAIEAASKMIKSGQSSVVIIAAADHPDVFKYLWFKQLKMYASDGKIKPFSKDSNGFILGDGGAGLVLEDLEHAKRRNAHIYAEYLGGGFSLEGWNVAIPRLGDKYYQKTILDALKQSNIKRDDIDLICAHGVGTSIIDYYEAKAITDIFGLNFKKPLVTAFKPYIGHNLGGSTLAETAILLLALENNLIPPVLNTKEVDRRFNISLVKEKISKEIKTVLKISCAFAGYNAATIFRKYES
jgi:3-oxoacyl-(acyl-carrier-protein) synthase